jgi:flagella basal body P-ring formation protein FlgA
MRGLRRKILGAAAVAAALCSLAAPALAGQRAALKDDLAASGAEVRLGDLFDNAGEAADVPVARANGPTMILDARAVQAVAAAHGLDWANPNGYRQLVVKTGFVQAAAPRALADAADPAPVAVRAAPAAAERSVQALTWTRDLLAGDVVRPEDLAWTKIPARLAPHDAPRDPDALVGQAARRALREGAAVGGHDVAPPKVIRRDQDVEVTFAMDGIRLVLTGRALSDASVGEPVQVLNTQSKKTIDAVASGPGRADVGPDADARRASRFASLQ